jgi:hypothetical protein
MVMLTTAAEPKWSPAELAAKIDEQIRVVQKREGVPAAPRSGDAEFVRRVYLDLTGRVPDILSVRDFLDDPSKDKRAALIRRLLQDSRYARHWSDVWRNWLLSENDPMSGFLRSGIESWLQDQLQANTPYDQLVRRLLLSDSGASGDAFLYQVQQYRPENMAAVTSRLFLGVKLECAQCHDHPFAAWKKRQFWEFAAFFASNPSGRASGRAGQPGVGKIVLPSTEKEVAARFLDGKQPEITGDARRVLLNWMTAKDNPYFARAMANRMWEQLLGAGLVEPLDEESEENPASHPELLTLLAKQFSTHDYDLKYLIEAIVRSETYQQTSRQTHPGQAEPRLFARMRTRGLTPEQLFDSLALVTGVEEDIDRLPGSFRPMMPNSPRAEFLVRFPNQDRRAEQQTSILQALYLMNGPLVTGATSLKGNRNLAIIAQSTSVRTARKVEQLFLIALNRKPTDAERDRLVKYVDSGGATKDSAQALCDVFWALLNSSEFCTNH